MDLQNLDFFTFKLDKQQVDSLFDEDENMKKIAITIAYNLQELIQSEQRMNKLNFITDKRNKSIFEVGLLDSRLKVFIKQCGAEDNKSNSQIFDEICNQFWTYVQVRGDGNCFYRSFMLGYILNICMKESNEQLVELIIKISQLKDIKYSIEKDDQQINNLIFKNNQNSQDIISLGSSETIEESKHDNSRNEKTQQSIILDTSTTEYLNKEFQTNKSLQFYDEEMQVFTLVFLLQLLIQKKRKNYLEVISLLEYYNSQPQLDISLVIICKNILLSEYHKMKNDISQKDFIDDAMENEIINTLTIYRESAQDLVFFLAARAFNCEVQVQNIYFDLEQNLISNLLSFENSKELIQASLQQISSHEQQQSQVHENNQLSKLKNTPSQHQEIINILNQEIDFSKQQENDQFNLPKNSMLLSQQEDKLQEQLQKIKISVWYTGGHYDLLLDKAFSEQNMFFCFDETISFKNDEKEKQLNIESKQNLNLSMETTNKNDLNFSNNYDDNNGRSSLNNNNRNFLENSFNDENIPFGNIEVGDTYPKSIEFQLKQEDSLQKIVKQYDHLKIRCLICDDINKPTVKVLSDENSEDICVQCFTQQYSEYTLEDCKETFLNIEQIQSCLQQIITKNAQLSKCLTCHVNIENPQVYQILQAEQFKNIQCLFCMQCLNNHFSHEYSPIQDTFRIFIEVIQSEIEFKQNDSLNEILQENIKQQKKYLDEYQNQILCNKCLNKLKQINIYNNNGKIQEQILLCINCLYDYKNLRYDQMFLNIFQNQCFWNYLKESNLSYTQCICCNENQVDNEYFSFIYSKQVLNICINCIFNIEIDPHQKIEIKPINYPFKQKLFVGQKAVYKLIKFISKFCYQCKQNNIIPLEMNQVLKVYQLQYSHQLCTECREQYEQKYQMEQLQSSTYQFSYQLDYIEEDNYNSQNLYKDNYQNSQHSLDNLNIKRSRHSSSRFDMCQKCNRDERCIEMPTNNCLQCSQFNVVCEKCYFQIQNSSCMVCNLLFNDD